MPQDPGSERVGATDLSIMVVAFQSADVIADCLSSIPAACTRYSIEILLIDNGDGSSADLVAAAFPNVRTIASQGNVGFAAGNNIVAAQAKGKHVLLLNPDVVLKPHAIDLLLDATARYPSASAWGGVTLGDDEKPDLGNTVHIPSLHEMASRLFGRSVARVEATQTFDQDERVAALSGAFAMLTRDAWDIAGGLDERYFLYCEEVDLFFRLGQMGHEFWRIAEARAVHSVGHGEPASARRQLYLNAGIMEFTRIHWSTSRQAIAFTLMWLGAALRFVSGKLLGFKGQKTRKLAEKHRLLVFQPGYWRHGYHPSKGLLAKLKSDQA